jgi:hypothetical protein
MGIKFRHWKDRASHGLSFGRNAHLRNVRSWSLWAGPHCFTVELHGLGPAK